MVWFGHSVATDILVMISEEWKDFTTKWRSVRDKSGNPFLALVTNGIAVIYSTESVPIRKGYSSDLLRQSLLIHFLKTDQRPVHYI